MNASTLTIMLTSGNTSLKNHNKESNNKMK